MKTLEKIAKSPKKTGKKHAHQAIAYLRTSSAANVGNDKDSEKRQRIAIQGYAKANRIEIIAEYYDAAVKGADRIDERAGFAELLAHIASNGVRTILVETASRFARDLIVQETGYQKLKGLGIELIAVDSPESFLADGPTANLIRQVLGAVSEFEKAMLVAKLKGARERIRAKKGKCEGRKSYAERGPEGLKLIEEAKALNDGRSLRAIASALAEQGFVTPSGKHYAATAIQHLLK